MRVKRNTLLLLACLVWGAAGFNILRIGAAAYPGRLSAMNILLSALVFTVFQLFIFGRLVKKHSARIAAYLEERQFFPEVLRCEVLCDHGGHDGWRYRPAPQRTGSGGVHRRVLHGARSRAAALRTAVRAQFLLGGFRLRTRERSRKLTDAVNYNTL